METTPYRVAHIAILIAGTLFLLTGAFHGNLWFDETYSVAIASHSFSEIWRIGAGDVHPVLFYWMLHCLELVFGQNVLVYRFFAVAGSVCMAALGYTHVRRDFGWRCGMIFSFLALFMPYIAVMATEIRMYSWATFAVMLCFLMACRIIRTAEAGSRGRASTWAAFFASSLASAYLHYFGAIAAFLINACVLAVLVRTKLRSRPMAGDASDASNANLAVFLLGAILQLALYAPWLQSVASQLGVVSQTYWANIVFPTTLIELMAYPVVTSTVSFALRGFYGPAWQCAFWAVEAIALVLLVLVLLLFARNCRRFAKEARAVARREEITLRVARTRLLKDRRSRLWQDRCVRAATFALGTYVGVCVVAWIASFAFDSFILYYRYLFVAIGPLLFALSVALARVRRRAFRLVLLSLLLATAVMSQWLLCSDNYDERNDAPIEYFESTVEQLQDEDARIPMVVSSDIGVMGVTAVECTTIPQEYLDWQKGNWALSYEAYAPVLESKKSWEEMLDDYHGKFVVLGQSQTGSTPRDVADLAQKKGVDLLSQETFYRPYERTYFTVAVMDKA